MAKLADETSTVASTVDFTCTSSDSSILRVHADCMQSFIRWDCTKPRCCCLSGYGNIAPQTFWGRMVCISYALVGIPIMLMCLANLGALMANIFRFIYAKVCCCGCCISCHKRRKNRHASAVFSVVVCPSVRPSVCPSQAGMHRNDWTNRVGFWHEGFLLLSHTVLSGNFGISEN